MKQFLKQLIVLVCGVTLVFAAGVIFFSDKRQAENEGAGDQELLCLAKQGDATAQAFLESMYYEGDDVFQYYEQAFSWYPKAAEQGDASAQAGLGLMYYEGHGVPQDYQQAVSWFRKAAEQGEASAQMHLGLMYYEGHGVPQDYEKAFSLVRKAAEQGHADAQSSLGVIYYKGEGDLQDYKQAHMWMTLGRMNTQDQVWRTVLARGLSNLEQEMSQSDIAEAQQMAKQRFEEYSKRTNQ